MSFQITSVHTHVAESYSLTDAMEEYIRYREELRGYADPDNDLVVTSIQEVVGGVVVMEFPVTGLEADKIPKGVRGK